MQSRSSLITWDFAGMSHSRTNFTWGGLPPLPPSVGKIKTKPCNFTAAAEHLFSLNWFVLALKLIASIFLRTNYFPLNRFILRLLDSQLKSQRTETSIVLWAAISNQRDNEAQWYIKLPINVKQLYQYLFKSVKLRPWSAQTLDKFMRLLFLEN